MGSMAGKTATDSTRFGDVLRRHRLAARLTQEELAERAGLSRRGIADLERGERQHPRKDTVALLAEALGLAGAERATFDAAARGMRLLPHLPTAAEGQTDLPAPSVPEPPAPSAFGARLRQLRLAAGLTQGQLAARAGLSERAVNDLERAPERTPRLETVTLLADALSLAPEARAELLATARPATAPNAGLAPATVLPTGTVTFLFTDIEGSTRLLQGLGREHYAALRAEHYQLLQAALATHGGSEVDSQSESSFMVFSTAGQAVAGAIAMQRALAAHPWPAGASVRVRMGLHSGTAQLADGHYIGLDVHRAARIAAAGHGGQVLLSQTTRDLVETDLPADVTLRDLGMHLLKDLQRPEQLSQLVLPDLPADFPPLSTLARQRHNLPIQLTSFIGRERELAELTPLLLAHRLLTLTGPGGAGKTRLSLSLAADVLEQFADGVWHVELAPLADPTMVPQTVAAVLGVREQPGSPLLDVLCGYLRPKTLLLVLDNCEHLIATCAEVAETLLRAAPDLRILTSSREPLGIAGETAYRVPSLPLPDPVQPGQPRDLDLAALARNDCVRLFVERAAATSPALHLTARNAPAIVQIGRQLDGIPLALELAAARTRVLPPEQIVARLDDRFRLLTGGSRTALPRHQTLLALIEWSHDLLSEAERVLLRRLAVFAGGWSLEAAQAVCGDGLGEDVLETLEHLADKSLIDVEPFGEAAEGRYRLLETIRQYARDKLLAASEAERVQDRHLEYCAQLAEAAEPHLRDAEQLAWMQRLEREHDNLRAALAWALEGGKRHSMLRLAGALAYFWDLRGYWSEGCKWLDDALDLDTRQQGGGAAAQSANEPTLPTHGDVALRARVLYGAARLHVWALMDFHGSLARIEESLRLWRELGDKWWMAVALEHVGFLLFGPDHDTATARLEEGVALAREVEDHWPLALCMIRLAQAVSTTDPPAARRMCEEGVAVARRVGDRSVLSLGLEELSPLYWWEENLTAAESVAAEALLEGRAVGSVAEVLVAYVWLVCVACYQGDLAKAREHCAQYLDYCRETGATQWLIYGFVAFGLVACFSGETERGVRLYAASYILFRVTGFDKDNPSAGAPSGMILGQALEKARAQLGEAAFAAAWAEGEALTLEQALALALEQDGEEAPLPNG
jgi:predicted ATPase/class 3 adenylate cyclase